MGQLQVCAMAFSSVFALGLLLVSFSAATGAFGLASANPLVPPLIHIDSPQNNKVYSSGAIPLNFTTIPDMPIALTSFTYSLDDQPARATNGSTTLIDLPSGSHKLTIYGFGSYFGGSEPYESRLTVVYFSVNYSTAWVVVTAISVSAVLAISMLLFWKRKQVAASLSGKKEAKFWVGLTCFLLFSLMFFGPGVSLIVNDYLFPHYSQSITISSHWGIAVVCFFMVAGLFLMWRGTREARSSASLNSSGKPNHSYADSAEAEEKTTQQ